MRRQSFVHLARSFHQYRGSEQKIIVEISLILTNNPKAGVLERAEFIGIKSVVFNRDDFTENGRIDKLLEENKIDFEEGWHYIRVLPWTAEGDPIPMNGPEEGDDTIRSSQSEPFYVMPGGKLEEEPPQRAIPFEKGTGSLLLPDVGGRLGLQGARVKQSAMPPIDGVCAASGSITATVDSC